MLLLALCLNLAGCSGAQKAEIFLSEEQLAEKDSSQKEENAESGMEKDEVFPEAESTEPEAENDQTRPVEIFVDVCGAVANPGVYGMQPGSRVFQAIEMAGGFLPEAAGTHINQAQALSDGQQIYVPTKEEAEEKELTAPGEDSAGSSSVSSGGDTEAGSQGKINLNTADAESLQTLSGIGQSKAEAILAYREEYGSFSSIEEIMKVPGIKESTFSKIKDKIAVE